MNAQLPLRIAAASLVLSLVASSASAAEVTRAGRWHLHSSFWMNLHQTLMHDAAARKPRDLTALSSADRAAWQAAVDVYREHAGKGDITFSRPMVILQDELTQVADGAVNPELPDGPLSGAILAAAPVYRARWWRSDDRANRFFIAYAAAMLRDAGEELAERHEAVYGERFPDSIRVDIAAHAGAFGAYSHPLRDGGFTVTMSSSDAGYAGLAALEMLLHESSHAIVGPRRGRVAAAIDAAVNAQAAEPQPHLWHAILFATSGELARQALAARGASHYKPVSDDLFSRVWPQYRDPIAAWWLPYLNGSGTLEEAIAGVVAAGAAR